MAKQFPDYMGTYKALIVETGIGETKNGFPQFIVKGLLTAYYDQKEGEWFDVSDNEWTMSAYLNLIGRKGGVEDGEPVRTLNFAQVMTVFDWDGVGLGYLQTTDFKGKEIQFRIAPNTGENAKSPCQVAWVDVAGADPGNTLRSLDADKVKAIEGKFAGLWESKKVTPATAKKPAAQPAEEEAPAAPQTDAERKAAILAKGKRLLTKNKTEPAVPKTKEKAPPAPTKGKKAPPAEKEETPADDIPPEYGKKDAWNDVIDCKAEECTDEQLGAAWHTAIAEIAEDGDEDKLDNAGWFAVKEQVLAEVGKF